jgi:hypothetical protein
LTDLIGGLLPGRRDVRCGLLDNLGLLGTSGLGGALSSRPPAGTVRRCAGR